MENFLVDYGIPAAYWLSVIGAILTFFFAIYHMVIGLINTPKQVMKTLLGLIVFAALIFIIYAMSPGDTGGIFAKAKYQHVHENMKFIETGVTAALAFIGIALGASVLGEVFNAIFR